MRIKIVHDIVNAFGNVKKKKKKKHKCYFGFCVSRGCSSLEIELPLIASQFSNAFKDSLYNLDDCNLNVES